MTRAWQEMSHEELTEELEAGRTEARRRMAQMARLLGMGQTSGKRGRPAANPFDFAGEDQEESEDAASAAAS
jgi:response regulator of citrate/malate metabolism